MDAVFSFQFVFNTSLAHWRCSINFRWFTYRACRINRFASYFPFQFFTMRRIGGQWRPLKQHWIFVSSSVKAEGIGWVIKNMLLRGLSMSTSVRTRKMVNYACEGRRRKAWEGRSQGKLWWRLGKMSKVHESFWLKCKGRRHWMSHSEYVVKRFEYEHVC